MQNSYLLLGTNMGNREQYLLQALKHINDYLGTSTVQSSIYETESWGYSDNNYLNQIVGIETTLTPEILLQRIHEIEAMMGRKRTGNGYEARPIDIDILFYGDFVFDNPVLTIPHPLIQERRFVLIPMNELNPTFIHPKLHKSIAQLLEDCQDKGNVAKYKITNYELRITNGLIFNY